MSSDAVTASGGERLWSIRAGRLGTAYFTTVVLVVLAVGLASLFRHEDPVARNVSLWLSVVTFGIAAVSLRAGLIAAIFLLTITPALHQQLNTLMGTRLFAWTYPGVDCVVGFIAAWVVRGGIKASPEELREFPSGTLLALHGWIAVSAALAVWRNLWMSASEFSLRGLVSHAWLVRRIGLQDDYFPLQDLFYFSVALSAVLATWSVVRRAGGRCVEGLAWSVLAGAAANAVFAVWQVQTGKGWFLGPPAFERNAFWPDLHTFAGFMAMATLLGVGLIVAGKLSNWLKVVAGTLVGVAAMGLYLSGSRSTLLLTVVVVACGLTWASLRLRGWVRAASGSVLLALVGASIWTFSRGYRGVSFTSLRSTLQTVDSGTLNIALSHRPEIWGAVLDMYSRFPIFGLGQGALYRLSSIPEYARSKTLDALDGSGAHNYFLQFFVELGPVALGIALLLIVPFLRMGAQNFRLVSFYALFGIAISNVYAHSLLTREMLMLAAVFAGTYIWEARALAGGGLRPLSTGVLRRSTWALLILAAFGLAEATASIGRFPFSYGQRCFVERPLTWDSWAEGILRVPVPPAATSLSMTLAADRKDVPRRPLEVEIELTDEAGVLSARRVIAFTEGRTDPVVVSMTFEQASGRKHFLLVRPSHCYVPLNVGRGHDGRHLGVRVQSLQFSPG